MAHLIRVYDENHDFVDELHRSGNLSAFYEALEASNFDQGVCGDGEKNIDRSIISHAAVAIQHELEVEARFLSDLLCDSESGIFIFKFM